METKLRAGNYLVKGTIWNENGRLFFNFGYNKDLITEIKMMRGSKYHGYDEVNPRKLWSIDICPHNEFQLRYLMGDRPYDHYDKPLVPIPIEPRFNKSKGQHLQPYSHQPMMTAHMVQRKRCIVAGEMGTTKTFCCITALEILSGEFLQKWSYSPEIWYVAPRSALRAVQREFIIWGSALDPQFMTYETMVKKVKNWEHGTKAPPFIIFDESSKLKTHTSQRSQAAQFLADGARKDWGDDAVVILMTGTPAPKSPSDWWSQCEIACPGFIKEGDIYKFNNRLGIIVKKESFDGGGSYPSLVTWRDDERKCNICGKFENDPAHNPDTALVSTGDEYHSFIASKNEIEYLYKRLAGLVVVYFKKDCLDLPDKTYREILLEPTGSILRAAKLIAKGAKTVIEGLTRLRELSDGFQYVQVKDGKQVCSRCEGRLFVEEYDEIPGSCPNCTKDGCLNHQPTYADQPTKVPCGNCGQTGEEDKFIRSVKEVATPKEQALIDLLDEYEDVGRVVIFAGFTGSIDRCVRICLKQKWAVIRIDQGKEQVFGDDGKLLATKDYLSIFQDLKAEFPRVAFIAHPGSGGMGLTLTASPVSIYWSNDFNGEYRSQSEDRIHRPGMDLNLGATIVDMIHLPSDRKVLENLRVKRNLELITLGELSEAIRSGDAHDVAA
jgi:hypothetical protein